MTNTPPIWLHPGFAKTGTTSLQKLLLTQHRQLAAITPVAPFLELQAAMRCVADSHYNEAELYDLARSTVLNISGSQTRALVYSDERLTAMPSMWLTIAERLKRIFPDAHVLFTIRNQLDAVKSHYAHMGRFLHNVPQPYWGRHVPLDAWLEYSYGSWPHSCFNVFDYDNVIQLYEDAFGRERIHVFTLETNASQSVPYIDAIAKLLDINIDQRNESLPRSRKNARVSRRKFQLDRIKSALNGRIPLPRSAARNRFLRGLVDRYLADSPLLDVELSAHWEDTLAQRYQAGNRRLQERYGVQLDQLGYPT